MHHYKYDITHFSFSCCPFTMFELEVKESFLNQSRKCLVMWISTKNEPKITQPLTCSTQYFVLGKNYCLQKLFIPNAYIIFKELHSAPNQWYVSYSAWHETVEIPVSNHISNMTPSEVFYSDSNPRVKVVLTVQFIDYKCNRVSCQLYSNFVCFIYSKACRTFIHFATVHDKNNHRENEWKASINHINVLRLISVLDLTI